MKKLTYILVLLSWYGYSQNTLTKEQALQTLLENNYAIQLSKNDIRIAENNASIYNSKYLPSVAVGAGANYSNMNQEIEAQSGVITSFNGSETQNYNASIGVNYTLFNGFNRKYATKQLQEQLAMSHLEANAVLEQAILDVFSNYYQTAQVAENVRVLQEALQISKTRLKRTNYQYDYGQTTKLAVLNAEVDVNNDSINYINTKQLLENSKRNLLLLIGDTQTQNFAVETGVQFATIPTLEILLAALPQNTNMQQIEKALEIGEYSIKMSKSNYLPTLGANSSYGWSTSKNPVTSLTSGMMNYGLNAGLSLNWNIFDGGNTKTRVANAKIALDNQEILQKQQIETLENTLKNTWEEYHTKLYILRAQEQNVITTQNNFDRTEERYKLGQVTSIEFRQAQINLLNTQTALNNAKYDAKLIELELLQLSGQLLNVEI